MQLTFRELKAQEVTFTITAEEIKRLLETAEGETVVDQPRALRSLEMGTTIRRGGYNIFVSGFPGSGRRTAVQKILNSVSSGTENLKDIVFVYNFKRPEVPRVLYFPPGQGPLFKKDIHKLIEKMKRGIGEKLTSTVFDLMRDEILSSINEAEDDSSVEESLKRGQIEVEEQLEKASREIVHSDLAFEITELNSKYGFEGAVAEYLEEVKKHILENLYLFFPQEQQQTGGVRFLKYGVNVIEDRSVELKVPVVFETNPTKTNLFGSIEMKGEGSGEGTTNFMLIKGGSLIHSSGGAIVIQAEDLLAEEDAWKGVKRVIRSGKVQIEPVLNSFGGGVYLKPEPVDVDIKVILVGSEDTYYTLFTNDPEMGENFKILAEFDSVMNRDQNALKRYIQFIHQAITKNSLLEVTVEGTAAIIEYGVRLAEDKEKVSTRFSLIEDLLIEADYWAKKGGGSKIDREVIENALKEREYQLGMDAEKIDESILRGETLIQVTGKRTGRINGLTIYDKGYYSFGKPALISARVAPGEEGVVNIEGEAGLSGEIHDKGVYILEGFLRSRYAQHFPLSVYASICFEQSYVEIEGDSASAAEVYALMSAMSELPLRQDIAVTGSMNQEGEIQPVGGIIQKTEGFFRLCRKGGLTGTQGVIIPAANEVHLCVSREVSEAVKGGMFHIYPISTIDEGIEILSGKTAGKRDSRGRYPADSVNHLIEKRLKEIADRVKAYSG